MGRKESNQTNIPTLPLDHACLLDPNSVSMLIWEIVHYKLKVLGELMGWCETRIVEYDDSIIKLRQSVQGLDLQH